MLKILGHFLQSSNSGCTHFSTVPRLQNADSLNLLNIFSENNEL